MAEICDVRTRADADTVEAMVQYLVQLSVQQGRPVTWFQFRHDPAVDTNLLKQQIGLPVSIESRVAARYNQYLEQHPEDRSEPQLKPLTKPTEPEVSPLLVNQATIGYDFQITPAEIVALIQRLSSDEKFWYQPENTGGAQPCPPEVCLEVLSEITEANLGGIPNRSVYNFLGRKTPIPGYERIVKSIGNKNVWIDQLVKFRQEHYPNRTFYEPRMRKSSTQRG